MVFHGHPIVTQYIDLLLYFYAFPDGITRLFNHIEPVLRNNLLHRILYLLIFKYLE